MSGWRPSLHKTVRPAHGSAVAIGHGAVKLFLRLVEYQRQEILISFPQRQFHQAIQRDPFQRALGIVLLGFAGPTIHAKNKAKPVLSLLAETGPANGSA